MNGSKLFGQLLSFGAIGAAAFFVDAGILLALVKLTPLGLYAGRIVSFICAATFTWVLNRRFTFAGSVTGGGAGTQWLRYLGANAVGALANLSVYVWLVSSVNAVAAFPALAVAAGSVSGLAFNFTLSRWYVFRNPG